MSVAASLRALLAHSIDYAGMFPPCSLALEPALENQAKYVRSADAWMLSTFVLPVAQFDAARDLLSSFDPEHPLRVSALGPRTDAAPDFREALAATMDAIGRFASNVDLISVGQLEMLLPNDASLGLIEEARAMTANLPVFWEFSPDRAKQAIAWIEESNATADAQTFGYKLRTGGVTADAFPTSAQIAAALVAPIEHQVPIKFTAGLHHPIRQFREEVKAKMYGFLNVLGAAALAAEYRWDEAQTAIMLEDENRAAFSFDDEFFAWREFKIETRRLEARRRFVTSFGSCSFDEPREDLRALGLF
jgi:hypothetical protein